MKRGSFADHFSTSAESYAEFRPSYSEPLFAWLASVAPARTIAWDCATGSGQAALGLTAHFGRVIATDPSVAQLAHARRHSRVEYAAMTAEHSALSSGTIDLITVAQAVHWFDRDRFYSEVRRTLRPAGVLAIWSYALGAFGEPWLDDAIRRFYSETVGPLWPAERWVVDAGLGSIEFPFEELAAPQFEMKATWTLEQLAGYLSTWSAVQRARVATGADPLPELLAKIRPGWGAPSLSRTFRWPMSMRVGRT